MDDPLRRFHIRTCVGDALGRHGVAHDRRLRAHLEANATIAAGDGSSVIMRNGNSLDAEIEHWLNSSRMDESAPTGSRTLAKGDSESVRGHFADIAAGRVRVTE